ncbi:MAG: GGDEF domain-containing protein [Treponema sp.]|nr:GGDEF domain-containing protein [Treponema sp.]
MENKKKSDFRSIKISHVNIILMVLACFLCFLVYITSINTKKSSTILISTMNDYAECNKAINDFREASEFLTNEIRLFAVNKDSIFMDYYFQEVNEFKRRENDLSIIEMSHNQDEVDIYLRKAFETSKSLEATENLSFRLICESSGVEFESMPESVRKVIVPDEINSLSKEEKLNIGRNYLFDVDYLQTKAQIINYVDKSLNALMKDFLLKQDKDTAIFNRSILVQHLAVIFLSAVSIILFLIIALYIIKPLRKSLKAIEIGHKIKFQGAYELRYIQNAYNILIEKTEIRTSVLKYKAEHDPLTGLINRDAFQQIKEVISKEIDPVAYLILDVDNFKTINDKYGHLTGDEVLKLISSKMQESFSEFDYIARIGGDEFAILMTKLSTEPESEIKKIIDEINDEISHPADNMPPVSLSVGIAISDSGFNKEMEPHADIALYNSKKAGRCRCSFY